MAFQPSTIIQGARRAPLTSKQGGVGFYKGTGPHPALGPKSQGSHGIGRVYGRIYRLEPKKMRTFMVPEIIHDLRQLCFRTDLRPYTESTLPLPEDVDVDRWPIDRRKLEPKVKNNLAPWHNRDSIYSFNGFDGDYFRQLMTHLREQNSTDDTPGPVSFMSKPK
ncbi:hypothetical protein MJO28_003193 [Puccinia striiformis f. sp. tritici]|uniref:Uncharacterized protein n=4 Tax=Puccinia striiformis TaxID=27350 RepID=A0A0L0VPD9_9BASI|nr:hypothetical protein Pst134EA_004913 [Puccinia striiformis f. sp. tritici]KAI9621270.1 hypothetical protein H4Q26_015768 [Puccinia striiformis f. sp. tritici PST-130]KNF00880.1 hypothetical protein PSTG_05772 [Puccinia striiformis f. sp. tritici PST-78]POV98971.1 hypothetical protein PSHT_13780 [Puccinia striiformis]KAH9462055.1 hypothetical protein Pst134EB_005972 [Puccinia striiformis f. sp. tritici]KAH9471003.1 hypothetical protein Pst134EA_004913 [Puccinia striiformis f. sp. tritici]